MRKKRSREVPNLFDLKLERAVEWENGENGRAVLLVPKFRRGLLARYLQPRLKRPYYRIKLDELGTFIWRQCDGTRTVKEVADSLREAHGDQLEQFYERTGLFIQILLKNRYVCLKNDAQEGRTPGMTEGVAS